MQHPVAAVLFDLGGVLVRLDTLANLLGPSRLAAGGLAAAWLRSNAVRALESGRCPVDEFAARLVAEFELEGTADELLVRFRDYPQGLFPGAVELVGSVPAGVTTGLLSNTNELHWQGQRDAAVLQTLCDLNYLSYRLGLLKPDRAIFDHVVADLALDPDRVLFIDDNALNVEGARAAGLRAECAAGPVEASLALRRHGVTG